MPSAAQIEWPQGNPLFEVQWRAVAESLAGNGIQGSTDLVVSATANTLEIEVATGTAYYIGSEYSLGTTSTFTLTSGGASDRWDTVYFDTATSSAGVREGTAGSSPEPPDVQGDELLLAVVYIPANATDVPDSDVLNWRAEFSNEAEEIHYDDSTGSYAINDVDSALDELQKAAQISAYPLSIATDTEANAYPLNNNDLANSSLTINAGSGISTTNGTISLGGTGTLSIDTTSIISWDSPLEVQETTKPTNPSAGYGRIYFKSDGFLYSLDSAGNERNVHGDIKSSNVSSNYTTDGESILFVDSTGTGGVTITIASADLIEGHALTITDSVGAAETNPITIVTEGTETIEGNSSIVINTNLKEYQLHSDGTNWKITGGTSNNSVPQNIFEGRESGTIAAGDQGVLAIDSVKNDQTTEIYKASLTTVTAQAISTGVNLELVTFDNAGGYTTRSTLISGDGTTIHDRVTGNPLASYNNISGSEQTVGVIVDNTTAGQIEIMASVEGEVPI